MNIEKGKISDFELMFLILCFILGSITFISFADTITKHDTWIVIISAYAASIPFILSYILLVKKFPGKNLIQINDIIYGRYLGKLISILYIWFILTLLSLNLKGLADFYTGFIMPETPSLLFLAVCALVCAYAVQNGLESMGRISAVIFFIITLNIIVSSLLGMGDMDFSNFLPVFEMPLKTYFQSIHIILTIQMCEIIVFLMVMPNLNNFKHTGKYTLLGLTISTLLLMSVSIRNTAVLGVTSSIYFSDSYQALRLIDIGDVLTKMDILFAIGLTLVLFIKNCVLYYATVAGMSQMLNLRSYKPLILPVGSIAVCLAIILFDSVIEHNLHARSYHAILVTPFELILPPLSLLIAKIRGLPKKQGGECK
ncbi:spore germination protein KB [Anaerobacterium chartisolvens]|uniref:Spore germination protein KB n=1 Tax=Anaerobacterium chartisolvens TaxID=1297424 RepID=A0A369BK45_9FIRM|nr:endospore germination permease [Anaerobacterium chartisolvens]RCX20946.1 spore germination protein KB [Anaerobacterium chartisolvens]